jgi:hypothetical protein
MVNERMAYGTRKILIYGVIGILAATILSSSIMMLPNLFVNVNARTGTLVVKVTDAPVPDLLHLNLTISSVEVLNRTGGWMPLPISGGTSYFDLLKLENVTRDLAISSLPVGNYSKIRLRIDTANATLGDGRKIDLNVPPGRIDLQVKFEIKAGKTTSLIVDIVADKIQIAERGKSGKPANLNPQFKLVVIPPVAPP